jgi:secondary thiamine-phosphate synthase enzyme
MTERTDMTSPALAPSLGFTSHRIQVHTSHARQFIDITDRVLEAIEDSGVREGLAVVASRHTTAAIVVNEHEPELLKDLESMLDRLAPAEGNYSHNSIHALIGDHPNGHAHCQALLLNASATIPIIDGISTLGRYQRVFLVELDLARPREVTIAILGV